MGHDLVEWSRLSVLRATATHWIGSLLRLAFGVLSLLALEQPATASGCHVAEKPILGSELTREIAEPFVGQVSPAIPHYQHLPCPEERPNSTSKVRAVELHEQTALPFSPLRTFEYRLDLPSDPWPPGITQLLPERPPRIILPSRFP